ncbi:MAG: hypothetical protein ABIH65_01200 [Nanoarchaeota archaeon]
MKKTLATLALGGLLALGGCDSEKAKIDEKVKNLHVGQKLDCSIEYYSDLVEENTEYLKYKYSPINGNSSFITVKNDTIVSI